MEQPDSAKQRLFTNLDGYTALGTKARQKLLELEELDQTKGPLEKPDVQTLEHYQHIAQSVENDLARIRSTHGNEYNEWHASRNPKPASSEDSGPGFFSEWNTGKKLKAQAMGAVQGAAELPALAADLGPIGSIRKVLNYARGKKDTTFQSELQKPVVAAEKEAGLDPERFSGAKVLGSLATPGAGLWQHLASGGLKKLAAKGAGFAGGTELAREATSESDTVDPMKVAGAGVMGAVANPAIVKGFSALGKLFGKGAKPTPTTEPPPIKATGDDAISGTKGVNSTASSAGEAAKEVAGSATASGKDLNGVMTPGPAGSAAVLPVKPPTPAPTNGSSEAPLKVFGPPEEPLNLQKMMKGMPAKGADTGPLPLSSMPLEKQNIPLQGPPEPPVPPHRLPPEELLPNRVEPGQQNFKGMGLKALLPKPQAPVATTEPATGSLAEAAKGIEAEKALRAQPPPIAPSPPKAVVTETANKAKEQIIKEMAEKRKKETPEGTKGALKPIATKFEGTQKDEQGNALFDLHSLQEDIPLHPKGSTVSTQTLAREGFVPQQLEPPRAGKIAIPEAKVVGKSVDQPFVSDYEKGSPEAPFAAATKHFTESPLRVKEKVEAFPIDLDQHERYFKLRDSGMSEEEANHVIRQDIDKTLQARLDNIDGQVGSFLERARQAAAKPKAVEVKQGVLTHEEIVNSPLEELAQKIGYKVVEKSDPQGNSFELRRADGSVAGRGDDFDIRRIIVNKNKEGAESHGGDALYAGLPMPDFERMWKAHKLLNERTVHGGKQVQQKFLTPQFVYEDTPIAKEVTQVASNFARDMAKHVNQALYRYNESTRQITPTSLHKFDTAPKEVLDHIADFAWDLDKLDYRATPEMLKAAGHSEEVIQTYFGLRGALNRMANLVEQARDKSRKYFNTGEESEIKAHLRDRRPNWLPHDFGGKWEVYKDGKVWVDPETKISSHDTEWETALKIYDLKKLFPASRIQPKFYPDHDFQFSLDIEHALRVKKLTEVIATKYGAKADEIATLVSRSGSRKDFAKRFLQRTGHEGYDTEDLRTIIQGHVFNAARYIAKVDLKINTHKLLSGPEAIEKLDKPTINWLYNYVSHVAGRETAADIAVDNFLKSSGLAPYLDPSHPGTNLLRTAKQVTVHAKLGLLNAGYALFNTSVIPLHVLPGLNRLGRQEGLGHVSGLKYTSDAVKTYFEALNDVPAAKGLVDKLVNEGLIQIHLMSQPLPRFTQKTEGSNISLWMAKATEEATRTVAAIGRYKMLRAQGLKDKEALTKTYDFVNETMADFSPAGKAELYRGAVGGTAFLFKNFGSVMLQNAWANGVRTMLPKAGNKLDLATAAMYGTSAVAVAGLLGLPFAKALDNMSISATGFSPVQWLNDTLDERGKALAYGVGKFAGVYTSSRAGVGDIVPQNMTDVVSPGAFKPIWNAIVKGLGDQSFGSAADGFKSGLINWLEPANIRPYKREAVEASNKYLHTKLTPPAGLSGNKIYDSKNQVVIDKMTPWEKFVYRATLMPERLGETYDRQRYVKGLEHKEINDHKAVLDALRANPQDKKAWKKAGELGMKQSTIQRSLQEARQPLDRREEKHTPKDLRYLFHPKHQPNP